MGLITYSKYVKMDSRNRDTNIYPGFRTFQYKDGFVIYVATSYSESKQLFPFSTCVDKN